jgi:hypothetical protein
MLGNRAGIDACAELGQELARAYKQVALPSGESGSIDFEIGEQ